MDDFDFDWDFDFDFDSHDGYFDSKWEDNWGIKDYANSESGQLHSGFLDWNFSSTSYLEVNTSNKSSFIQNNYHFIDQWSVNNVNDKISISGVDWSFVLSSDGNSVNLEHHNLKDYEVQNIIKQIDSNGNGIIDKSDLKNFSFNYEKKDSQSLYDIKVDVSTN